MTKTKISEPVDPETLAHLIYGDGIYCMGDGTPVETEEIAYALDHPRETISDFDHNGEIVEYEQEAGKDMSLCQDWDSRQHANRIAYLIRHHVEWESKYPIEMYDHGKLYDGVHRLCAAHYMRWTIAVKMI